MIKWVKLTISVTLRQNFHSKFSNDSSDNVFEIEDVYQVEYEPESESGSEGETQIKAGNTNETSIDDEDKDSH